MYILTGFDNVVLHRLESHLSDMFLRSAHPSNIQSAIQQEGHRDTSNSSRPLITCESCYK